MVTILVVQKLLVSGYVHNTVCVCAGRVLLHFRSFCIFSASEIHPPVIPTDHAMVHTTELSQGHQLDEAKQKDGPWGHTCVQMG